MVGVERRVGRVGDHHQRRARVEQFQQSAGPVAVFLRMAAPSMVGLIDDEQVVGRGRQDQLLLLFAACEVT